MPAVPTQTGARSRGRSVAASASTINARPVPRPRWSGWTAHSLTPSCGPAQLPASDDRRACSRSPPYGWWPTHPPDARRARRRGGAVRALRHRPPAARLRTSPAPPPSGSPPWAWSGWSSALTPDGVSGWPARCSSSSCVCSPALGPARRRGHHPRRRRGFAGTPHPQRRSFGPALGAAVAVAVVLGYEALYRESEQRRRLIEELDRHPRRPGRGATRRRCAGRTRNGWPARSTTPSRKACPASSCCCAPPSGPCRSGPGGALGHVEQARTAAGTTSPRRAASSARSARPTWRPDPCPPPWNGCAPPRPVPAPARRALPGLRHAHRAAHHARGRAAAHRPVRARQHRPARRRRPRRADPELHGHRGRAGRRRRRRRIRPRRGPRPRLRRGRRQRLRSRRDARPGPRPPGHPRRRVRPGRGHRGRRHPALPRARARRRPEAAS